MVSGDVRLLYVGSSTVSATSTASSIGGSFPIYATAVDNSYTMPNESQVEAKMQWNEQKKEVTAEFYFNHVKTNMTKRQQLELTKRMGKLKYILDQAPMEQVALREEMQKELVVVYLQQTAAVQGYDQTVSKKLIDEFMYQVEFRHPELLELKNFPRIIPAKPAKVLKKVQESKLFDSFWILTWNPRAEQLSTVTDRIIKKDPILFGRFDFDPETYYFITDWTDETCDLTFNAMVDELEQLHPDYEVEWIKPFSEDDIKQLVDTVRKRKEMLDNTNARNWKSQAMKSGAMGEKFSWENAKALLLVVWKQFRNSFKRK